VHPPDFFLHSACCSSYKDKVVKNCGGGGNFLFRAGEAAQRNVSNTLGGGADLGRGAAPTVLSTKDALNTLPSGRQAASSAKDAARNAKNAVRGMADSLPSGCQAAGNVKSAALKAKSQAKRSAEGLKSAAGGAVEDAADSVNKSASGFGFKAL
jgi:hypothetical protein